MIYNFTISPDAEKDIELAYDWYEQQQKGLDDRFTEVIEKTLISIQTNPLLYGFRKKNIRGCIAKDFPLMNPASKA